MYYFCKVQGILICSGGSSVGHEGGPNLEFAGINLEFKIALSMTESQIWTVIPIEFICLCCVNVVTVYIYVYVYIICTKWQYLNCTMFKSVLTIKMIIDGPKLNSSNIKQNKIL